MGKMTVNLPDHSMGLFLGREKEARRLQVAIHARQSLMIAGPEGIGKTALVSKVIAELSPAMRQRCIYVSSVKDLHDLLRQLIRSLFEAEDAGLRRELHAAGVSKPGLDVWFKSLSTSRLRGTLYRTVQGNDYRIFLDHFPPLTRGMARVIKELFWMRATPVYLVPKQPAAIMAGVASHYFYWGERELLNLRPLPAHLAREILEACIQRFGLARLDLEGFREEVLELSRLVPGAIVTMCEMAADPHYQFDSQIKTKLVHIDYLMRGCAANFDSARTP
ncbi:MAG TPA: ATP-binding protein [Terriglobia bacterium]|nr:ATP-binding protein [Terriglobia bacterium]